MLCCWHGSWAVMSGHVSCRHVRTCQLPAWALPVTQPSTLSDRVCYCKLLAFYSKTVNRKSFRVCNKLCTGTYCILLKDCRIVRLRDAGQPNIHYPTSNIHTHSLPIYLESYDVIFAIEFSFLCLIKFAGGSLCILNIST